MNIEDSLFAGAVIDRVREHFYIRCDSSNIALNLYRAAQPDLLDLMKANDASHYHRLYKLRTGKRYPILPYSGRSKMSYLSL